MRARVCKEQTGRKRGKRGVRVVRGREVATGGEKLARHREGERATRDDLLALPGARCERTRSRRGNSGELACDASPLPKKTRGQVERSG